MLSSQQVHRACLDDMISKESELHWARCNVCDTPTLFEDLGLPDRQHAVPVPCPNCGEQLFFNSCSLCGQPAQSDRSKQRWEFTYYHPGCLARTLHSEKAEEAARRAWLQG